MKKRALLVAEAPSYSTVGLPPLVGPRGDRFARFSGYETRDRLAVEFEFAYLLDYWPGLCCEGRGSAFPVEEARPRAEEILREATLPIIVLGKRAAKAFPGVIHVEFFRWYLVEGARIAVVPFPSALDEWVGPNDPGAIAFFASTFPAPPGGMK